MQNSEEGLGGKKKLRTVGRDMVSLTIVIYYSGQSHIMRPRTCHSNVGNKYRVILPNWHGPVAALS